MERKPTDILHEELWQFPMDYPLKVMGETQYPMAQVVADIIRRHVPACAPGSPDISPSSKGEYGSVRATFRVECKEQINGLYADLAAEPMIKMVL